MEITSFDQLAFSSSGKGARIFREFGNERLRLGRFTEDGISLFESGDFVFAEPVSLADATMLPPLPNAELILFQEDENELAEADV